MTAYEFLINGGKREAGAQSEHTEATVALTASDFGLHIVGDAAGTFLGGGEDIGRNFLQACYLRTLNGGLGLEELGRHLIENNLRTDV